VTLLVKNGADIDAASLNGSTPLHSAAVCYAKAIFRPLFEFGCDYHASDNNGMTALHYVVKDIEFVGSEYLIDLYTRQPKDWIEDVKGVCRETASSLTNEKYPWLEAFVELVVCSATTGTLQDPLLLSSIDKLAQKTNVSKILLGSNQHERHLFTLLLTPYGFAYDFIISENLKTQIELHDPTEILRYITRFLVKTFPTMFPESTNCSSLLSEVTRNFVYTMNTALKLGLDVNCRDVSGMTPLLVYLRTGGRHMSKVLVKHNVDVKITCGDSFKNSVFHLASYHKLHYLHYLSEFLLSKDNWKKYLQTENAIFDYFIHRYEYQNYKGNVETIRTGDGPLTLASLSHPMGAKVIDQCFDVEGYNALHRAAQGANLIAIHRYLSLGANALLKNSNGFSS